MALFRCWFECALWLSCCCTFSQSRRTRCSPFPNRGVLFVQALVCVSSSANLLFVWGGGNVRPLQNAFGVDQTTRLSLCEIKWGARLLFGMASTSHAAHNKTHTHTVLSHLGLVADAHRSASVTGWRRWKCNNNKQITGDLRELGGFIWFRGGGGGGCMWWKYYGFVASLWRFYFSLRLTILHLPFFFVIIVGFFF